MDIQIDDRYMYFLCKQSMRGPIVMMGTSDAEFVLLLQIKYLFADFFCDPHPLVEMWFEVGSSLAADANCCVTSANDLVITLA